jgi:sugar/nucleoside kinase (ribokinase family)
MTAANPKILIIGCASTDIVHLEQKSISVQSNGGAGLYTALAAAAAGANCKLLAPKPEDVSALCLKSIEKLEWIGPLARQGEYPHLEIIHHGNDRATLCNAGWGIEPKVTPSFLPENLSDYAIVHIAALSSASRQLEFLKSIKAQSECKISTGTYARVALNETATVRELCRLSDFVFMNENEASIVFDADAFPLKPGNGQIICITKGKRGALIYFEDNQIQLPASSVEEYDPTGAGDTFAGTMLASLSQGLNLEQAAQLAIERSALVITEAGPLAISALIC